MAFAETFEHLVRPTKGFKKTSAGQKRPQAKQDTGQPAAFVNRQDAFVHFKQLPVCRIPAREDVNGFRIVTVDLVAANKVFGVSRKVSDPLRGHQAKTDFPEGFYKIQNRQDWKNKDSPEDQIEGNSQEFNKKGLHVF